MARPLLPLLAPLLIWAGHFFIGYGLALVLPASALLDPMIAALTLLAFIVLWWLWRAVPKAGLRRAGARQAILLSALAIFWQGLVVLF